MSDKKLTVIETNMLELDSSHQHTMHKLGNIIDMKREDQIFECKKNVINSIVRGQFETSCFLSSESDKKIFKDRGYKVKKMCDTSVLGNLPELENYYRIDWK